MFVKNSTTHPVALGRGTVYGNTAIACLGVERVFDILDDGTLRPSEASERADTDPPDIRRTLLWRGTSVTAFGHVHGPSRGPHAVAVRVTVGDHAVDLAVYGDRRWERAPWGGWTQSEPEPFDGLPLSWDRAFGGTVQLEPGYFPGTELPHPGGPIAYPLNADGMGYVIDRETAHGVALPNVENPAALLVKPEDTPTPVGTAPCPKHVALRPTEEVVLDDLVSVLEQTMVSQHHAPTPLLFRDAVAAGTPIAVHNIGDAHLRFTLPASPLRVQLRRGSRAVPTRERIRSVHVDADTKQARITWGHFERYDSDRPPRYVHVEAAP